MKKILPLITFALLFSSNLFSQETLLISEVADPDDKYSGRFIELYNAGDAAIDFSSSTYFLSRQSNGGSSWGDVQLTGNVDAGGTYVIANQSDFSTIYGTNPDLDWGGVNGNGDDAYYLYKDGDHTSGTLVDIYGAPDVDGTGEPWEYLDSRALRNEGITAPNTTWTAAEWTISPANTIDFNPGLHYTAADQEAPIWTEGYPAVQNIIDTAFEIVVRINEPGMVHYVVLESGATEPTVAEVLAATGSSGATAVASGSFIAGMPEITDTVDNVEVSNTYDIYLVAADDEAVPNVQDAVHMLSVTTIVPPETILMVDFTTSLAPFDTISVSGDTKRWEVQSSSAYMSGYNSGDLEEDWLISPSIDLGKIEDAMLSFNTKWRYGNDDADNYFKLLYSTDYDGNTENLASANWTEISFNQPPENTWTEIGPLDVSSISTNVYFAFKYHYAAGNYKNWNIDDFKISGYLIPGSDATLSALMVDGNPVIGFDPAKLDYTVELPAGTTTVPTVTYTFNDENASAEVTNATDLNGDAAARTTSVVVTAQDGSTTQTYTILFNPVIEVANLAELRAATDFDRKYKVTGEVILTHKDSYRNKKYIEDATAAIEIDDQPGIITTEYNIGDGITGVTGTLESYYGYLQLHPTEDPGAASSTGNAVEPQVLTIAEFTSNFNNYVSEFVKLEGVGFADAGGTFANGKNYKVGSGDDSTVVRVHFYYTSLTGMTIPNMADVAGVALWDYSTAKVAPRSGDDLTVYSADATLSDLQVNGTTIENFDAAVIGYDVLLPAGTTEVPDVTYTTASANASVNLSEATNVTGTEAERTTTVEVVSEDGSATTVYTIVFSVDNTGLNENQNPSVSVYPVPAMNELRVKDLRDTKTIEIINVTGRILKRISVYSNETVIDISDLSSGLYILKTENATLRFIKK